MRPLITWLVFLTLIAVTLSACRTQSLEPTPTIKPSSTPFPTATCTLAPTHTQVPAATTEPTATITPAPVLTLELGERQDVIPGGFSFQSIRGYDFEMDGSGVGVFDSDRNIVLSVYGVTNYTGGQTAEKIIDEFLGELEERGTATFEKREAYTVTVNTVEGTAFDLTGEMYDAPIEGQTILVMPSENQYLFGLAIANLQADKEKWKEEGRNVFAALLESIEFIEGQDFEGSACPVSSDKTYGYSKENPIQVGGDWLDGPAREMAYLDSLSGPNGEPISYERIGSLNHGSTILDEYEVSYSGASSPAILYLDEYSYTELMAPVGFTCWMPIPLTAP